MRKIAMRKAAAFHSFAIADALCVRRQSSVSPWTTDAWWAAMRPAQ